MCACAGAEWDTVEQLAEVMQQVGATEVVCESEAVSYTHLTLPTKA